MPLSIYDTNWYCPVRRAASQPLMQSQRSTMGIYTERGDPGYIRSSGPPAHLLIEIVAFRDGGRGWGLSARP